MNDVKLFAKKFENEIDVNALRINIKMSIIEIKSFVKEFRNDVTNENKMLKIFRKMTTTNFCSTNITITNEFAKDCRVELTSDFAKIFFVSKIKV